jgi:FtsP/CotA-like multicopper oxidase with cupredoxin domain
MMMGMCKNVSDQDWSDAPYTTILTNGKGWMMDPATKKPVGEAAVIKVQKGKRYRLRFIQGAGSWGIKVTMNKHTCRVIALDGINIMPKDVKGFTLTAGERLDCILNANRPVGNYYINIATLVGNNSPAVLSYVGAPDPKSMRPPVLDLGCQYALPEMDVLDFKNETDLAAFAGVPRPPRTASKQLVVYLSNSADPEGTITKVLGPNPTIPGLTGVKPQQGCKLANGQESMYCWTLNWVPFGDAIGEVPLLFPDARLSPTTYMVDVPLNGVVDIALINPGAMVHPMHMHGTHFWVLGTGNGDILTMDGKINYTKLNIDNPVYRDTQPVANAAPASRLGMGPMDPVPPMKEGDTLSTASADTSVPADSTPAPAEVMPGMPAGSDVLPASSDMPGMGGEKLVYGYAVIRFKASNAGVWPFHCHIDLHANTGMLMGFRVPRRVGIPKPWALPKGVTQCGKE